MKIENRLKEIGIKLPDAPAPAANYVPSVVVGDIVYISGQVSYNEYRGRCESSRSLCN